MEIKIYDFLEKNKCEELVKKLQTCDLWQDGKLTTGTFLKDRKTNNELVTGELHKEILENIFSKFFKGDIGKEIYLDTHFNLITPPMVNRYHVGEYYGWHFDQTCMPDQNGNLTRMDYSFTIFFNDDYEGGELQIEDQSVKGKQGQMVVYDNKLRHRVTEITEGTRYACVGWMQSLVPDVEVRERLEKIQRLLNDHQNQDSPLHIELHKIQSLLLKKFT